MRLSLALFAFLLPSSGTAFSTSSSSNSIISHRHTTTTNPTNTQLAAQEGDEKGDDGGWFDDYDDFVSNLDFEGGEWDKGADAPFEGGDSRGGGYESRGRGGGGGGGGGYGNYGNNSGGHDYTRDPSDSGGSVDETAVNELLASRLNYRKKRMYDAADDIRDELQNVHGVSVWDRDLMWSVGGRRNGGGGGGGGRERGGGGGRGDRSRGGGGGRGDNRFDSRGGGREREFNNDFNEFGHDYSQVNGPTIDPSICTLSENEIHTLIKERMECKFARDFQSADAIQAELQQAGVEVHDGFKEWRADGEQWGRSNRSRDRDDFDGSGVRTVKEYFQRGPGMGLSEEDTSAISALVAERSEAKSVTDYNRADEIFATLQGKYNVNVDDKNGQWSLLHEEYLLSKEDTAMVPNDEMIKKIGTMLGERILARKSRNFQMADDIRDELRDDYMVEVDDQVKEWVVVSPEGGRWSDDEEVGEETDVNVESAEEWFSEADVNASSEVDFDEDEDNDDESEDAATEITEAKADTEVLDESTLSSLTVPILKEKLREAGLPVSGRKSELIERLISGRTS